MRHRLWILAVVGMMATAACGSMTIASSAPPMPDPTAAQLATSTVNGITFQRPADWTAWQSNDHAPYNDGPLLYLSTDALLPACAAGPDVSPNPADDNGRACDWPLESLEPNGALVTWGTSRILQPIPSNGGTIEVNGEPTSWSVERPGSCDRIGADETIVVVVPMGQASPGLSNIGVIACLRGPDLASAEAKVEAMLVSATGG